MRPENSVLIYQLERLAKKRRVPNVSAEAKAVERRIKERQGEGLPVDMLVYKLEKMAIAKKKTKKDERGVKVGRGRYAFYRKVV